MNTRSEDDAAIRGLIEEWLAAEKRFRKTLPGPKGRIMTTTFEHKGQKFVAGPFRIQ
jgi:hypothetical protein